MMKKQKIMLYRIIAAAVIYVPLFVLEHMGKLEFQSEIPVQFLLFMIPYLIVGWDIIYRAVRNICHGQVFEFLSMVWSYREHPLEIPLL